LGRWRRLLFALDLARRAVCVEQAAVCDFESWLLFAHRFSRRHDNDREGRAGQSFIRISCLLNGHDGSTCAHAVARMAEFRVPGFEFRVVLPARPTWNIPA